MQRAPSPLQKTKQTREGQDVRFYRLYHRRIFCRFFGIKIQSTVPSKASAIKRTGTIVLSLTIVGALNQGWGSILQGTPYGEAFFVCYRLLTLASCLLAVYMYYRDYHKREAEAIAANKKKRGQETPSQTKMKKRQKMRR